MQVHLYAGFFSHLTGTIVLREPWLAQSLDAEPQDREEGQLTIKLYITLDLFFFCCVGVDASNPTLFQGQLYYFPPSNLL